MKNIQCEHTERMCYTIDTLPIADQVKHTPYRKMLNYALTIHLCHDMEKHAYILQKLYKYRH